jgi:hypothetical protein
MNGRYILAIDPGTVQSAFVCWDCHDKIIGAKGISANVEILTYTENSKVDTVVIEMVASYGMPVGKEVFDTCVWIGRFYQASPCPVHLIYRKDVKMHLCGNMRAKDGNIRQALIDLLGKETTKGVRKDEWSALALAITYSQTITDETDDQIAKECGL